MAAVMTDVQREGIQQEFGEETWGLRGSGMVWEPQLAAPQVSVVWLMGIKLNTLQTSSAYLLVFSSVSPPLLDFLHLSHSHPFHHT